MPKAGFSAMVAFRLNCLVPDHSSNNAIVEATISSTQACSPFAYPTSATGSAQKRGQIYILPTFLLR